MKPIFLLAAILIASSAFAQEADHAPAAEQCQADQRLWLATLEMPDNSGAQNTSLSTLHSWAVEMRSCIDVDPANNVKYLNTLSETTFVQVMRLSNFLRRHNLTRQFAAEDAAGKR